MTKSTLKKVFNYIKKYWIYLSFSLILALTSVVLTLYLPILVGKAVDHILAPGAVEFQSIWSILKTMLICIGFTAIAQWLMSLCNNKMTYHVVKDIRQDAFEKIEILPLKYIDGKSYGEVVSRVITDVDQFSEGLLMGFTQFFTGVITILGTLIFMLTINLKITLIVILITPLSLFVASYIAKKTFIMFQKQSETRGEQTAFIDEMIQNQKVVQAFQKQEETQLKFRDINQRLEKYSLKAIFFSSTSNPSTRFINSLVYTGVGITGALAAINGTMTVGQLTCFLTYANQYTKPFNEISSVITELQNAMACAGRIFELIEEQPQMPEAEEAICLAQVEGEIQFKNVNFSYTENIKLIENLNLFVKPGQRIAIVGPTGSGKSTLINLLMRFYEVNQGEIRIDGKPIQGLTRKSLRLSFGMVLQDTWLKAGTIKENIAIGKPDASMEEIIQAAKASHAHSFIKRLSKGYDTIISRDGGNLSQGQRQLLSIARVMLCLPPMLILDEATSSIDTRTEIQIQKAFKEMMEGRTSFIVAHRLSTIKEADLILVMKDGNIIEQGNHQELLRMEGFYWNLYQNQFRS